MNSKNSSSTHLKMNCWVKWHRDILPSSFSKKMAANPILMVWEALFPPTAHCWCSAAQPSSFLPVCGRRLVCHRDLIYTFLLLMSTSVFAGLWILCHLAPNNFRQFARSNACQNCLAAPKSRLGGWKIYQETPGESELLLASVLMTSLLILQSLTPSPLNSSLWLLELSTTPKVVPRKLRGFQWSCP